MGVYAGDIGDSQDALSGGVSHLRGPTPGHHGQLDNLCTYNGTSAMCGGTYFIGLNCLKKGGTLCQPGITRLGGSQEIPILHPFRIVSSHTPEEVPLLLKSMWKSLTLITIATR
jgi:hypothetical protein